MDLNSKLSELKYDYTRLQNDLENVSRFIKILTLYLNNLKILNKKSPIYVQN